MTKKIFLLSSILLLIINLFACNQKKVEEEPIHPNEVIIGTVNNFYDEVYGKEYVLVVFYETKSHWSKSQVEALEIFKNDREIGNKIKIVKINIEENEAFINKFNLETAPTHLLFKNGEIIYRNIGYIDTPHLNKYLKPYIKFNERK